MSKVTPIGEYRGAEETGIGYLRQDRFQRFCFKSCLSGECFCI